MHTGYTLLIQIKMLGGGIALPPVSWLLGMAPQSPRVETYVQSVPPVDLVVHTVGKVCRLALKANPNMLEILFCRDDDVLSMSQMGWELRQMRDKFLSQKAYRAYSGYALGQLKIMANHNTDHGARRDSIERWGYDTKNAMHLIRLLLTARTLLAEGRLEVYRSERDFLLAIRRGKYSRHEIQKMADDLDQECRSLSLRSPLPSTPDVAGVEQWLVARQRDWVNGEGSLLKEVKRDA